MTAFPRRPRHDRDPRSRHAQQQYGHFAKTADPARLHPREQDLAERFGLTPRAAPDRPVSFELWDDLVRQCVLWLAQENIAALGDPAASIASAEQREPERRKLAGFLETAAAVMGVAPERKRHAINPRILGRWIERHTDDRCRAALWQIERAE